MRPKGGTKICLKKVQNFVFDGSMVFQGLFAVRDPYLGFLGSGPDRGRSPVEWGDFPSVRLFVRPFIRPFIRPFVRLSVRLFVRLFVCLFVSLSVTFFHRIVARQNQVETSPKLQHMVILVSQTD